jgi:hypothetical protein
MQFAPKTVACNCGHITTIECPRLLCIKCGKSIYYNEKEKKSHRYQTWYVTSIIAMVLGFMVYFFVEMILKPIKMLE